MGFGTAIRGRTLGDVGTSPEDMPMPGLKLARIRPRIGPG